MAATVKSNLFHSGQSQNLGDILAKSFRYSVFPEGTSNRFIPNGHVEDFVTSDAVMREFFDRNLPDWSPSSKKQVDELVQYVISSAKKLLAISILSGVRSNNLRRAMEEFKQHDFGDNDLPLLIENVDQYPPCFGEWEFLSKENFRNEQWRLLVPVFPRAFERIHLRPEHILPFTYVDSVRKEGTFGDVYQVTIHESHQEDPMRKADGSLANAAIKELKAWAASGNLSDGKGKAQQVFKEWQAEAKALEDTSRLKHEHIVTVKSIFTKGSRHYFMFQWADGGSLRDLYRKDLRPYLTAELVEEMVQQLLGLSDALSALHNYRKVESPDQPGQTSLLEVPRPAQNDESYRHGDLKPENILRFEDNTKVGVWKIADMGLARHHLAATDLRGPTDTLNATPSYEPPEVYTMPDQGRSRQYDVWSMGCIILELLVWMLYGPDAMIKFIKSMNGDTGQRFPYWEFVPGTKNKEARLREVVLKCMAHIRNDPECQRSTATRDLLKIVQEKLLVVNLPVNRPSGFGSAVSASALMSGPKRAKAETFRGALDAICDEGKKRKAYWFTGTERTKVAGPHQSAIPKESEVQVRLHHVKNI